MSSIQLKPKKAKPIASGHPWIFSGAIGQEKVSPGDDLVEVRAADGQLLGQGLFSPHSQIRVRMVRGGPHAAFGEPEITTALQSALDRRRHVGLPNANTDTFRWVNSEGDGLPGLIVDRLGNATAFQAVTMPMFLRREAIAAAIGNCVDGPIIEVSAPPPIAKKEGFPVLESRFWTDDAPDALIATENGVRFNIATHDFQKTGHYADMRIHRRWLAERCAQQSVLDVYSYTGGFGLYAAVAGAERVVCVDSSEVALDRVAENASTNDVSIETRRGKAEDVLRSLDDTRDRFDVVILDPPKLAPSRKHAHKALKVYQRLVTGALRVANEHALIAIGSCSEAIKQDELARMCANVGASTGATLDIVYVGAQSPDHPVPAAMSEAHYLTFMVVSASGHNP